jgi:hypothetical protein
MLERPQDVCQQRVTNILNFNVVVPDYERIVVWFGDRFDQFEELLGNGDRVA